MLGERALICGGLYAGGGLIIGEIRYIRIVTTYLTGLLTNLFDLLNSLVGLCYH